MHRYLVAQGLVGKDAKGQADGNVVLYTSAVSFVDSIRCVFCGDNVESDVSSFARQRVASLLVFSDPCALRESLTLCNHTLDTLMALDILVTHIVAMDIDAKLSTTLTVLPLNADEMENRIELLGFIKRSAAETPVGFHGITAMCYYHDDEDHSVFGAGYVREVYVRKRLASKVEPWMLVTKRAESLDVVKPKVPSEGERGNVPTIL